MKEFSDKEIDDFVAFHVANPIFYQLFSGFVERWSVKKRAKVFPGSALNRVCDVTGLRAKPEWAQLYAELYTGDHAEAKFADESFSVKDPYNVQPTHVNSGKNWRLEALNWRKRNPEGYSMFVKFAVMLKDRQRRFGVNLIRERVRWETHFTYGDDRYKFCNTISPYIARMLIMDDPELVRCIECRETRW